MKIPAPVNSVGIAVYVAGESLFNAIVRKKQFWISNWKTVGSDWQTTLTAVTAKEEREA